MYSSPQLQKVNISVIIPMYNSQKTIKETLQGLGKQARKDFEVIVVDDGSTDSSAQLVEEFRDEGHFPLKLIRQANSGPAKARNAGVAASQGEIVIFLDSDCVTPPNWLETMVLPLRGQTAGVGCGYQVRNRDSLIARYVDSEIAWRHHRLLGKKVDALGSYSASFLKPVFLEAQGFDTSYREANAEDFDLAFKIHNLGHELAFTDQTFVYHYHPSSLRKYLRQQYKRGYWRMKLYLENRQRIFKGEAYTGHETQVQFLLTNMAFLSLPLTALFVSSILAGLFLLFISNLPLGLWAFRRERKFLLLAPALASLRSVAGTLGVYSYVFHATLHRLGWRPG